MKITRLEISSHRQEVRCKQVLESDVHKPDLEVLKSEYLRAGYDWAREDYNVYRVTCQGETGIGIGPMLGEFVGTELRTKDAQSFYTDDANVKFTPLSDRDIKRYSTAKRRK